MRLNKMASFPEILSTQNFPGRYWKRGANSGLQDIGLPFNPKDYSFPRKKPEPLFFQVSKASSSMLPIFSFISTLGPSIINTTYSSLGILHSLWHGIFKVKKILLIYRKAEKDITGSSCPVTRVKQVLNLWYFKGFSANILHMHNQTDKIE